MERIEREEAADGGGHLWGGLLRSAWTHTQRLLQGGWKNLAGGFEHPHVRRRQFTDFAVVVNEWDTFVHSL